MRRFRRRAPGHAPRRPARRRRSRDHRHRPGAPGVAALFTTLTSRERQVAALVSEGLTNQQIARALSITLATVKDHVHSILAKTRLASRAAAWREP
jgi:DNA-binding NarL/FixJ family response regulator